MKQNKHAFFKFSIMDPQLFERERKYVLHILQYSRKLVVLRARGRGGGGENSGTNISDQELLV